jgi:tRNA(Ile)-lysidine synthase
VAPKGNVPDFVPQELSFGFEGESGRVSFGGKQICWGLQRAALPLPEPRAQCEWFDADKVGGTARLRHWRAGDRFQPLGLAGQPKLQDLFTNAKIDVAARRQALVATTDGGVLWWVEGLRIGDGFKVRPETRHLLKWEWSD